MIGRPIWGAFWPRVLPSFLSMVIFLLDCARCIDIIIDILMIVFIFQVRNDCFQPGIKPF